MWCRKDLRCGSSLVCRHQRSFQTWNQSNNLVKKRNCQKSNSASWRWAWPCGCGLWGRGLCGLPYPTHNIREHLHPRYCVCVLTRVGWSILGSRSRRVGPCFHRRCWKMKQNGPIRAVISLHLKGSAEGLTNAVGWINRTSSYINTWTVLVKKLVSAIEHWASVLSNKDFRQFLFF